MNLSYLSHAKYETFDFRAPGTTISLLKTLIKKLVIFRASRNLGAPWTWNLPIGATSSLGQAMFCVHLFLERCTRHELNRLVVETGKR